MDEYWYEIDCERHERASLGEALGDLEREIAEAKDCGEHIGGWRLGVSLTLDAGEGYSRPAKSGLLDVAALRREVDHWKGRARRAESALAEYTQPKAEAS